jgi:hypothetical protein
MTIDDFKLKGYVTKKAKTIVTVDLLDKGVAILFDYIDDETLTTEASITDNYVESNYALQDHIAIKPKIYRLRGCVGEVIYRNQSDLANWVNEKLKDHAVLQKTIEYMKPITVVSGVVSNYTQATINIVKQVESSFNRYKKMLDNFLDPTPYNNKRQQEVVSMLNYILQNRLPVSLKNLKYDYYSAGLENNYASEYYIQSISSHQGNNAFITDIEITIKEVRKVATKVSQLDKNKFMFGTTTTVDIQKQPEVNQSSVEGTKVPEGFKKIKEIKNVENRYLVEAKDGKVTINFNWVKKQYNQLVGAWQNRNMYNKPQFGGNAPKNSGGSW